MDAHQSQLWVVEHLQSTPVAAVHLNSPLRVRLSPKQSILLTGCLSQTPLFGGAGFSLVLAKHTHKCVRTHTHIHSLSITQAHKNLHTQRKKERKRLILVCCLGATGYNGVAYSCSYSFFFFFFFTFSRKGTISIHLNLGRMDSNGFLKMTIFLPVSLNPITSMLMSPNSNVTPRKEFAMETKCSSKRLYFSAQDQKSLFLYLKINKNIFFGVLIAEKVYCCPYQRFPFYHESFHQVQIKLVINHFKKTKLPNEVILMCWFCCVKLSAQALLLCCVFEASFSASELVL